MCFCWLILAKCKTCVQAKLHTIAQRIGQGTIAVHIKFAPDSVISCRCQKSFAMSRFSAPGLQRAVTVGFQHFLFLQNSGMSSAQQAEKPQKPWEMINLGQEEYLKTIGN